MTTTTAQTVTAVRRAASTDTSRVASMQGMLVDTDENGISVLVATDGHRLHCATVSQGISPSVKWLPPTAPADMSSLTDVPSLFPAYKVVLPQGYECGFTVGRKELMSIVKQLDDEQRKAARTLLADIEGQTHINGHLVTDACCISADSYIVKEKSSWLRVDRAVMSDGNWKVTTHKTRGDAMRNDVPHVILERSTDGEWSVSGRALVCSDRGTGLEGKIGINARYLLDALKGCATEEITVDVRSPVDPIDVRSGEFRAVIMPMRL
jgi:hypothetical protein